MKFSKALTLSTRNFLQFILTFALKKGCILGMKVTTLHKKGDRADPDNYRAVAVSSGIGKLFATILLDRLRNHRN